MALVNISTSPVPDDREEIFAIDGVSYTIPREVPGSLALEAMHQMRETGDVPATLWAMEELIGKAGMKALRNCKTVRVEETLAIQKIIRDRVFGLEEEEGKG